MTQTETERDRERQRQRDRDTERQRHRDTERHKESMKPLHTKSYGVKVTKTHVTGKRYDPGFVNRRRTCGYNRHGQLRLAAVRAESRGVVVGVVSPRGHFFP